MLALPHTNSWGFIYTNQAGGSTTPGTSITPGASGVEGSFTEFGPDASLTSETSYLVITLSGGGANANSKQHLLDIAYDAAGGTTYDQFIVQDLACGASGTFGVGSGPRSFHFPCRIPAGAAVAARLQGSNATAGTVLLLAYFYGKPSRPELWRPSAYSETLGYSSGTLGASFTPGNSGAFGSWVSLGTTAKKHFWAQLGVQVDNGTISSQATRCQLAVGDGSNKHVIIDTMIETNSSETTFSPLQTPCTWEIPAGAELWVRGNCSGTAATGYNATVALFGG